MNIAEGVGAERQKKQVVGVDMKIREKTEVGKAEEKKLDEEEGIARVVGDI